jgi:ribosomal protein S18 acetylase RimI-like enzyme
VAERGYVGLSSIVTAVDARNQGLGRRLVGHLLAWGQQHGAHTAHLAVMLDNAPALRLYARFGFREAYRYWYRARP